MSITPCDVGRSWGGLTRLFWEGKALGRHCSTQKGTAEMRELRHRRAPECLLQLLQVAKQIERIKRLGHLLHVVLDVLWQEAREQESLEWRLGRIVDAVYFSSLVLLGEQFHGGLKAVDIETHGPVQLTKLPRRVLPHKTAKAHELAHNSSVFLFHETLVRLEVGAPSGEGDLLGFTIPHQRLIDEFAAIIGIQPQDGKEKDGSRLLEGCKDYLGVFVE